VAPHECEAPGVASWSEDLREAYPQTATFRRKPGSCGARRCSDLLTHPDAARGTCISGLHTRRYLLMGRTDRAAPPLASLLSSAEDQLWADFERTRVYTHKGLAGSSRESAVGKFLREHLLSRFVVTTGQAVDARHGITTELDLVIYDSFLSAPLLKSETGPELMPAEALLAVVEVKTMFSLAEAGKCATAVASLAALEPYGKRFVASRSGGVDASDGAPRCMYSIFAFDSDVGVTEWAPKEWDRLRDAAREAEVDVGRIDRLTVLTRGLVVPPTCTALPAVDGKGILRDWFLHLSDFLVREAARREPYDWDRYGRRSTAHGWERLDGYASVSQAKQSRDEAKAKAKQAKGTSRGKRDAGGRRRSADGRSNG
jgi:hypothetical protein